MTGREPGLVWLNWLIGCCSAVLFAPLAWPLVTGRVFVFGDLQSFNLPIRHLYQSALEAGDSVLWTPSLFSGFYLHGEGQVGMCHPLHYLLYRFLPLGPAFNHHPVDRSADRQHLHRRALDIRDAGVNRGVTHTHGTVAERHFDALAVDINDVFHAATGTSSHTVSTCAV